MSEQEIKELLRELKARQRLSDYERDIEEEIGSENLRQLIQIFR